MGGSHEPAFSLHALKCIFLVFPQQQHTSLFTTVQFTDSAPLKQSNGPNVLAAEPVFLRYSHKFQTICVKIHSFRDHRAAFCLDKLGPRCSWHSDVLSKQRIVSQTETVQKVKVVRMRAVRKLEPD